MIKKVLSTAFLAAILQTTNAQTYSNEFLNIGIGARAHAMSNAVAVSTNDLTATYWNPAALSALDVPLQVGAMHAEWFADVANYDYIGIARALGGDKKRAVGISFVRLGIDQIPYTLNLVAPDGSINYDNVTEFSAADYMVGLSYAQTFKKIEIGGTMKIVRRVIGTFAGAWGVGADLGIRYRLNDNLSFAFVGRDITTTYNAWTTNLTEEEKVVFTKTGNTIPQSSVETTRPTFLLGAAYQRKISSKINILAEANAALTTDGQRNVLVSGKSLNLDPRIGLEVGYDNLLWLRGGVGQFQRIKNETDPTKKDLLALPTMGIGMRLGRIFVDYGLTNVGKVAQVNYSHIISVRLNFKKRSATGA